MYLGRFLKFLKTVVFIMRHVANSHITSRTIIIRATLYQTAHNIL